jgi:ankyrin repeat protein
MAEPKIEQEYRSVTDEAILKTNFIKAIGAINKGRLKELKALVLAQPTLVNMSVYAAENHKDKASKHHWMLLHFAARKGDLDIVKFLLGQNADWEARILNGMDFTPIQTAVFYGHITIFKFFIGISQKANSRHFEIAQEKITKIAQEAFCAALFAGRVSLAHDIFQAHPAAINKTHPALILNSAICGFTREQVMPLLAEDPLADRFFEEEFSIHRMNESVNIKNTETILLWLLQHIFVNKTLCAQDKDDRTALHIAAKYLNYPVALILLQNNPKLANARDKQGKTPLHVLFSTLPLNLLASNSLDEMLRFVKLLLSYNANPNACDENGQTPLVALAARNFKPNNDIPQEDVQENIEDEDFLGDVATLRSLLVVLSAYGADIHMKDKNQQTAKDYNIWIADDLKDPGLQHDIKEFREQQLNYDTWVIKQAKQKLRQNFALPYKTMGFLPNRIISGKRKGAPDAGINESLAKRIKTEDSSEARTFTQFTQ